MAGFEIINVITLFLLAALFLFGVQIFYYFPKVDIELLKARMFLNRPLMNRMWMTSVLSGALFVCYEAVRTISYYNIMGLSVWIKTVGFETITVVAFLVPYLGLTFQWYSLIKQSLAKKEAAE